MNLGPLYDYLSLFNGKYGLAIAAVPACLFILQAIGPRTDGRSRFVGALLLAAGVGVMLLQFGFMAFILYKSYTGAGYEFWPVTCSFFVGVFASFSTCFMSQSWEHGHPEVRSNLIVALVMSLIASPIVAGMLKLVERFHPLWP